MGIGGLHSCEKSQYVVADENTVLRDCDVSSYYPSIILQQKLSPKAMGKDFITIYQSIVTRRIEAKHRGDKVTADTLKICVNGSFGKLGKEIQRIVCARITDPDHVNRSTCASDADREARRKRYFGGECNYGRYCLSDTER